MRQVILDASWEMPLIKVILGSKQKRSVRRMLVGWDVIKKLHLEMIDPGGILKIFKS